MRSNTTIIIQENMPLQENTETIVYTVLYATLLLTHRRIK